MAFAEERRSIYLSAVNCPLLIEATGVMNIGCANSVA